MDNLNSTYPFDCTYTEVFNLLQLSVINSGTGLDRISANFLKLYANIVAKPISYLVTSLSFTKSLFA